MGRQKTKLKKIQCEICANKDPAVLHSHHIVERTELNSNDNQWNLLIICSNCHNRIHHGELEIVGVYPSTQLPYHRTVIYKDGGKTNLEGIDKPYYVPQPKQTKVIYAEDNERERNEGKHS